MLALTEHELSCHGHSGAVLRILVFPITALQIKRTNQTDIVWNKAQYTRIRNGQKESNKQTDLPILELQGVKASALRGLLG